MSYIVNQSRVASLTIGGVNYTNNLVSWTVSDSSAYKNGIIQTTGTVQLGETPGGTSLGDYNRNIFKRGTSVILEVEDPETGNPVRHPRGYLYVISVGYVAESSSLTIEVGCRLTLASLTEDISEIIELVPIYLEPERQDYGNCSASFASAGKCLYQDNQAVLQVVDFFDGDTPTTAAPGEWTSVLGVTAITAQPMLGGSAIPDELLLSYQVAEGALGSEGSKIEETIAESYYFLNYPVVSYTRIGSGFSNITGISDTYTGSGNTSSCGNSPGEPEGNPDLVACNEGYQIAEEPVILPAESTQISRTYYEGPSSQSSYSKSEKYGPAVEVNGQYFADLFAYCRYTWATACIPNGSCSYEGMTEILQSYSETEYYYGSANELVRTVQNDYENILSAAQPFDWRAGSVDGTPTQFRTINYTGGYGSSSIQVGSGSTLKFTSKVSSLSDLAGGDGRFHVSGETITFSERDSVGSKVSDLMDSITGVNANQLPGSTWQKQFDGTYLLVVNYPDFYITNNDSLYWPTLAYSGYWGQTLIGSQYLVQLRVVDASKIPQTAPLNLHSSTSSVTISSPNGAFYRTQSTITEYTYSNEGNTQTTMTYSSQARESSIGIYRSGLDALQGVKTVEKRTSRTITATPLSPDATSTASAATVEQSSEYPIFAGSYQENVNAAGPYTLKESIPIPLLLPTAGEVSATVSAYSDYLIRFIKGDALGYTIGEGLRSDIIENWRPGMPFRYVDPEKNKILAMRMDACSWGVTRTETGVVTNGIWIGTSNGTLSIPSNLEGNSTPSLNEEPPTAPVGGTGNPEVTGETLINSGAVSFVIKVWIGTEIFTPFDESSSVITPDTEEEIEVNSTLICFVSGFVLQPGSLLSTTSTGSIPIEAGGSLVTAGATIIDPELFPPVNPVIPVGAGLSANAANVSIEGLVPIVRTGVGMTPPEAIIQILALEPSYVGAGIELSEIPEAAIQIEAQLFSLSFGAVVNPDAGLINVIGREPGYAGGWTDSSWNSVSILLPFDSNYNDISQNGITVSSSGSGVQISSLQSKFGGSSLYFASSSGTAASIVYNNPSSLLTPGLGDFTAELWWYRLNTSNFSLWSSTSGFEYSMRQELSGSNMLFSLRVNGSAYYSSSANSIPSSSWTHLAVTRATGVYRGFVNGVLAITVSSPSLNQTTAWNNIGRDGLGGTLYGFMDEARFTKGVARYTASFTPPTAPFPNPYPR